MQKIIDLFDGVNGQRSRTHAAIKRLYPWYHLRYLSRFRSLLSKGGLKRDKFRETDRFILNKFTEAREKLLPVHGRMLQRWGLQYANKTNVTFSASTGWLHNFKKRNGIVSRKITLYTCRAERANQEAIAASNDNFRAS